MEQVCQHKNFPLYESLIASCIFPIFEFYTMYSLSKDNKCQVCHGESV